MRILVLGAGALGGYFGARLLAAGRDVTFLVRPGRMAQLAADGLKVTTVADGMLHFPVPKTVAADGIDAPYDLVLLSAKAYDLDAAMSSIAPAVGPQTAILPVLNGMAHLEALDARFGRERVLGGTSVISAAMEPDGSIRQLTARDMLFFGARSEQTAANLDEVKTALVGAGFACERRPDILQDMWNKWTFLATLAGGTCLMRANVGEIAAAGGTPMLLAMYAECCAVAEAEGYGPAEAARSGSAQVLTQGGALHASMLRDLEAGRPVEAQQIVGDLVDHAGFHKVEAPLLKVALLHLKAYEARLQGRPAS